MKREEATETPAPTPSRLTTLAPTVPDAIDSAYWTFVHPTRSHRLCGHLLPSRCGRVTTFGHP